MALPVLSQDKPSLVGKPGSAPDSVQQAQPPAASGAVVVKVEPTPPATERTPTPAPPKADASAGTTLAPLGLEAPAPPSEKPSEKPTAPAAGTQLKAMPTVAGVREPTPAVDKLPASPNGSGPALTPDSVIQTIKSAAERPQWTGGEPSPTVASKPSSPTTTLAPVPEGRTESKQVEVASFNGVTPGVSTLDDVRKKWGDPKKIVRQQQTAIHLYRVDPFEHVEAVFADGKAMSLVIRLSKSYPADAVARQLGLSQLRPVLISSETGEILGQSFPERGVLFSFEPGTKAGQPSMKVSQIILEPISAEPFLLRAETHLETLLESSLLDLDQALKLAPQTARTHWVRARVLMMMGETLRAVAAADEAVRLSSSDGQFRVTRAQILGQAGRFAEAIQDCERAIPLARDRLHVKARAQCLMGDLLGSGSQPDHKRAIEFHQQAIATADPLTADPHPAIRLPAKEVLIDAHLGAAHDIAWGNWSKKQTTVPTWLKRASAFAEDLIQADGGTSEHRFRVATRALSACVGAQGQIDPTEWVDQVLRIGQDMVAASESPSQKRQVQWELGLALYDAVQIYQMRSSRDLSLKHGERAIEYLEAARGNRAAPTDAYLLGRLYFRLGSIHALGDHNHRAAITWFEKAVPVLQQAVSQVAPFELGRLGETFVSMGVSYWETGQRDNAVSLTQLGVELMEKAVAAGEYQKASLDVPYANLATMNRQLGRDADAEKYIQRNTRRPNSNRR